jgi:hypothetical protein
MIACEDEKVKKENIIEESFVVESIEFQDKTDGFDALLIGGKTNDTVLIGTDSETFVLYLNYVTFYKTDDADSKIDIQKKVKDVKSIAFKDDITADLYLNKEDVKAISKKYASLYSETLEFKIKK